MNQLAGSWFLVLFSLLTAQIDAAGTTRSEPPAAEPHHLVWNGINLEVSNPGLSRGRNGGMSR